MAAQPDLFAVVNDSPKKALLIEVGKKYKGQPFEVLLADPQYALWLLSSMHELIKHGHPALFRFLVTRFGQPDRTPDHNKLQNRFLDRDFAISFAFSASQALRNAAQAMNVLSFESVWREHVETRLKDAFNWALSAPQSQRASIITSLGAVLEKEADSLQWSYLGGSMNEEGVWRSPFLVSALEFEDQGADVSYVIESALYMKASSGESPSLREIRRVAFGEHFRVEVKPVVGDDYPAILRAMKAVKGRQLLVGDYCGAGATWGEVVQVFALSGIAAVLLEDVERLGDGVIPSEIHLGRLPSAKAKEIAQAAQKEALHLLTSRIRTA